MPGTKSARSHPLHHGLFLLRAASVIAYAERPAPGASPPARPDAGKLLESLLPGREIQSLARCAMSYARLDLRREGRTRDGSGIVEDVEMEARVRFNAWVEDAFRDASTHDAQATEALKKADTYLKLLADGKPPVLDQADLTPELHLRALNYAYLKLLMCGPDGQLHDSPKDDRGYWYNSDSPPEVRLAYEEDGRTKSIGEADASRANLLFDPRGGTVARGTAFHRNYFRWRAAYVAALWDHGLRYTYHDLASKQQTCQDQN
jgi:hypothetical protein